MYSVWTLSMCTGKFHIIHLGIEHAFEQTKRNSRVKWNLSSFLSNSSRLSVRLARGVREKERENFTIGNRYIFIYLTKRSQAMFRLNYEPITIAAEKWRYIQQRNKNRKCLCPPNRTISYTNRHYTFDRYQFLSAARSTRQQKRPTAVHRAERH